MTDRPWHETRPAPAPRPRVWLAALLTLLAAGLGQVYAGHVRRGVAIQLLAEALATVVVALALVGPLRLWVGIGLGLVLAATFMAAVAVDAARLARRSPGRRRRRAVLACVAFVLAVAMVGEAAHHFRRRAFGQAFRIPSEAMVPTLLVGDHLYTEPQLYRRRAPQRGDVVIFIVARDGVAISPVDRRPDLPREAFVKRIVGLPGDTVEIRAGQLHVDGEAMRQEDLGEVHVDRAGNELAIHSETFEGRTHRIALDPDVPSRDRPPFVVEPGRYFVLGDNRDHSNDSRGWGTVRREEIVGPVGRLYWSWSYNGPFLWNPLDLFRAVWEHTRWERIDTTVR